MATTTQREAEGQAGRPANEITLISHSSNLYLYPIWLVGFLLALATYLDGGRMAVVPEGTEARRDWRVEVKPGRIETREGLILPAPDSGRTSHLPPAPRGGTAGPLPPPEAPHVRMSHSHWFGTWFVVTMLVVFSVTSRGNEPIRGLKLYLGALLIALAVNFLVLYRKGVWIEFVSNFVRSLHVQINLAGYLLISTWLFVVWLVSLFLDRSTYIKFTTGQVHVKKEFGQGEVNYDATNVVLDRPPRTFLRHWVIGLMLVRDVVIRIGGDHPQVIEWPNVICRKSKLEEIERLLTTRRVEGGLRQELG